MRRETTRLLTSVGAAALALVFVAPPAGAQVYPVTVTGTATCSTAGPVGRYTLNWTVTNGDGEPVTIDTATESGAFTGTITTFTPNPILDSGSATATDGPVPGSTSGTVTLTVDWTVGQTPGTSTGTIDLAGDCVIPPTTTSSSSSSSSTSSSSTSTVATIRPVTATPRFTG